MVHDKTERSESDNRLWISKAAGLPLKIDMRFQSGITVSSAFRYDNVELPSGSELTRPAVPVEYLGLSQNRRSHGAGEGNRTLVWRIRFQKSPAKTIAAFPISCFAFIARLISSKILSSKTQAASRKMRRVRMPDCQVPPKAPQAPGGFPNPNDFAELNGDHNHLQHSMRVGRSDGAEFTRLGRSA